MHNNHRQVIPSPYRRPHNRRRQAEAGQVTVTMLGVILVVLMIALGVAELGSAALARARSRSAADAVALAAAVDPNSATELAAWYERNGIDVVVGTNQATASSGPSQAAAWAEPANFEPQVAPGLVAIVARLEQLLSTTLTAREWSDTRVVFDASTAAVVRPLAGEFGLCEVDSGRGLPAMVTFEMC